MSIYLKPILTACYVFPVLAALFTLPYIIRQYHKYGSILVLRTGIVYTFIFYMMTSYFMTILPLPAIDSVTPESATMLLTPFDAVRRWLDGCSFVLTDFSTYKDTFTNPDFLQIVFNILLLLPFGVYLRYYFNRRWYQVLLLSFLYSLFFECTQLSGLYGIYPYPYRFFEVDDLICNTLGGMIGFWITPALLFFLPSRKRLDETAYRRGSEVSSFRRLFGLLADYAIILGVYFFVWKFTDVLQSFSHSIRLFLIPLFAFCYFTVCAVLFHGTTFGKFLVSIRLERIGKKNTKKHAAAHVPVLLLLLREGILHLLLIPSPYYILLMYSALSAGPSKRTEMLLVCGASSLIAFVIFFIFNFCYCFIGKNRDLFYDRLCRIHVTSSTSGTTQTSQSSL